MFYVFFLFVLILQLWKNSLGPKQKQWIFKTNAPKSMVWRDPKTLIFIVFCHDSGINDVLPTHNNNQKTLKTQWKSMIWGLSKPCSRVRFFFIFIVFPWSQWYLCLLGDLKQIKKKKRTPFSGLRSGWCEHQLLTKHYADNGLSAHGSLNFTQTMVLAPSRS